MPSVFTSVLVLSFVVLIFQHLNFLFDTSAKKKDRLCAQLSRTAIEQKLTLCSQEILNHTIIGVDGIHRTITVISEAKKKFTHTTIFLDEVQNCYIISEPCFSREGYSNAAQNNEIVESIELQFEFKNHTPPVFIVFYDNEFNNPKEMEFLRAKAEFWNVMFSKMLSKQLRVRA